MKFLLVLTLLTLPCAAQLKWGIPSTVDSVTVTAFYAHLNLFPGFLPPDTPDYIEICVSTVDPGTEAFMVSVTATVAGKPFTDRQLVSRDPSGRCSMARFAISPGAIVAGLSARVAQLATASIVDVVH